MTATAHNVDYDDAPGRGGEVALAEPSPELDRAWRLAVGFLDTITAPNTLSAYRYDLFGCPHDPRLCEHPDPARQPNPTAWLRWCAGRRLDPLTVRTAVIQWWLRDLAAAGQADGTRARRLSTVSAWYRWLWREDQVPINPVDKLRPEDRPHGREPGTAGTALSNPYAIALMDAADADGPRSAAVVALGIYQGLRVSDITGLDDSSYGAGPNGPVLTYRVKGGKIVRTAVLPEVDRRLQAWQAARTDGSRLPTRTAGATAWPMFTTVSGGRMSREQLYRLVRRLAQRAGIPGTVSPHDLRRTYGTQSIAEGAPIRDVQKSMGHAQSTTTEGYDHGDLDPDRHPGMKIVRRHAKLREDGQHAA